jgi:hypothetical protein
MVKQDPWMGNYLCPKRHVKCGGGIINNSKVSEEGPRTDTVSTGFRDSVPGLSSRLFLSKVDTLFECPMKYYWEYHKWYASKEEPLYFTFGRVFHKAAEIIENQSLAEAIIYIRQSSLGEKDQWLCIAMIDKLLEEYRNLGVDKVLSNEKLFERPLNGYYFKSWCSKADRVAELRDGTIWNIDFKTASGYGPATAQYYHTSMQTLSYFYNMKLVYPALQGTIIFVCTKTKEPKCIQERILLTKADEHKALSFMENAHMYAEHIEENSIRVKMGTKCKNKYGQNCPFEMLCWGKKDPAYREEMINMLFKLKDPDAHLFNTDA